MSQFIHVNRRERVLEITIDRPPANAVNVELSLGINNALSTLQEDDDLRVGIITGAGERIFCAGWDLKEVAMAADSAEVSDQVFTVPD